MFSLSCQMTKRTTVLMLPEQVWVKQNKWLSSHGHTNSFIRGLKKTKETSHGNNQIIKLDSKTRLNKSLRLIIFKYLPFRCCSEFLHGYSGDWLITITPFDLPVSNVLNAIYTPVWCLLLLNTVR